MKYRIQFSAVFDNTDANAILNEIETDKAKVFEPNYYTEVPNIRKGKKLEDDESKAETDLIEYVSIDFDDTPQTITDTNSGISQYLVSIDISFDVEADFHDCINYLESIKGNAFSDRNRSCRHFECNHDSQAKPLPKDGSYTYMNFDGPQLTYPL